MREKERVHTRVFVSASISQEDGDLYSMYAHTHTKKHTHIFIRNAFILQEDRELVDLVAVLTPY